MGITIKAIGDFNDVVSNVNSVQKALTKLKLPEKLGNNLNKNITSFYKEYEKYQQKIAEGIHTQGDQNAVNKSLNSMLNSYEKIIDEFSKLSKQDFKDIFNLDEGAFASVQKRIKEIQAEIRKIKIDPKQLSAPMEEIKKMTKAKAISGSGKGLDKIQMGIDANDISLMKEGLQEVITYYDRFASKMSEQKRIAMADEIAKLKTPIENAISASDKLEQEARELDRLFEDIGGGASRELGDVANALDKTKAGAENVTDSLKRIHQEEFNFNKQAQDIDRQIQSYFGLSQMIRKVGDIARDAFATVKELDAAMTQTAVVTNFSVGDMWDMLPTYTAQANQLGSTIKDVYEAATLYYQQGLNTNQAMGLANETLKMARIAGLDAADATNMMTAALRGFNMEINQMSAQKVNDIYSELAAITASDTAEIGSAMERTASIANSANMEFATTSAFLAQMIETTREAPENLGTAMKTIIARFQEMKQDPTKLVDSEGVAMDANKVDKALKTIGVQLMNTKGEFRDLDDVFLDIASKWDSLSQGQQRYIATIAAGSRQQSRFIAMMSDYERTMELVDAANNSAGASQRQFEKTLDSMEAKLNKLKNAWDQFTMGLMNNQILKFGVDALTEGFTIVNKFIDILGKIPPKPFEGITKSVLTLVTTLGMLNFGKKASRGLVMGGAAWWKGEEGGFGKNFMSGFSGQAAKAGTVDGQVYAQNFSNALKKGQLKEAFNLTQNRAKTLDRSIEYENTFQAAFGQFSAKELSAGWSPQIEAEIRNAFQRATTNVDLTQYGIQDGDEYLNGLLSRLSQGEASALEESNILKLKTGGKVDLSSMGVNPMPVKEVDKLSNSLTKAGASLQTFGMALQDTPLAPFGALLSKIGMLTNGFGESVGKAFTIFKNGMAGTAVAEAEVGAGATAMAAGEATATTATGGLIGGIQALWGALLDSPLFPIIAVLAGLVVAYKLLDAAIVTNKEKIEAASDAAAAASEAYDSAKQETSELADAIAQIEETDSAFDGLVAGTAEFNEQLVTANEQIMALIDKYPMLNDSKYLSTDKNGLMHINEEGFKAVKEYQKQIQARASAMNLIQTADLNAVENQQKADNLRKVRGAMTQEEHEKNLRDADLLEQRIKAETKLARQNAIRTDLVDKEIANQEKIASIYVDQYEAKRKAAEVEVGALDKHDIRQAYADYHGYTYEKSTKKIKDIEGNEIDYDDTAIKDEVIEQTVMLDFEANASSLEGILNQLDRDFSKTLDGTIENTSGFISDVLSNNAEANEDLLEQVLDNPKQLNNFVESLSAKEIAAVLGASEETVESNISEYKKQLEDKLLTNARNIIDTNAQANGELAAMLGQAQGKNAKAVLIDKNVQAGLIQQVKAFTSEQRNTLLNIGKTLEASVGSDTMATFVDGLSKIYRSTDEQLKTVAQNWVENINWDSATDRLRGYNEAVKMTAENTEHLGAEGVKQMNELGQAMLDSKDEANLLSEAFSEFYNSTDFQDMAENMDKFVDSSGKLNAASVMDMAEECHSLNNLLDTGAISAGGVAAALNALGSSGDLVLSDLNSRVLELLSNFGQLDDIIASSHRNIENFDWGIDTGEAEDFVEESAKKWNELYSNGEVGNPQMEAYAKWVMGEDKYIALLAEKNGDLRATMEEVSKTVNKYSDGFENAWDDLANGEWKDVNLSDNLKDLGISVSFDDNGDWEWDPGKATTAELQQWLQEVKGIGPELAQAMIEDWSNYSPNFRAERQKNDFAAGLDSYVEGRRGANGEVAITASELKTIAGSTGQTEDEVVAAIADRAGIETDELNVLQNIDKNTGEYITDGAILNKQLTEAVGAKGQNGWLSEYKAKDSSGKEIANSIDIESAMAGAVEKGYTAAQAKSMAYESYTNAEAQGKDYYYKGELLEAGEYKTLDQFAERLAEIDQNEQWTKVGEAIADGFLNRMDENDKETEDKEEPSNVSKRKGKKEKEKKAEEPEEPSETKPKNYTNSVGAYKTSKTGEVKTSVKTDYEPDPYTEDQEKKYSRNSGKLSEFFGNIIDSVQKEAEARKEQNESVTEEERKHNAERLKAENEKHSIVNAQLKEEKARAQENAAITEAERQKNATELRQSNAEWYSQRSSEAQQQKTYSGVEPPTTTTSGIDLSGTATEDPKEQARQAAREKFLAWIQGLKEGTNEVIEDPKTQAKEKAQHDYQEWKKGLDEGAKAGQEQKMTGGISEEVQAKTREQVSKLWDSIKQAFTSGLGGNLFGSNLGAESGVNTFSLDTTAKISEVIPPLEKPEIPVKAKLEIEGNTSGGFFNKIFGGKSQGPTIDVVANVASIKAGEQQQTLDVIGNVTKLDSNSTVNSIDATATVTQVIKSGRVAGEPISVKAIATTTKVKNETPDPKQSNQTQTIKVAADTSAAQAKINQLISLFNKTYTLNYTASGPTSISVPISANFTGSWEKTVKINKSGAKGINNYIGYHAMPSFGSVAKGRYGMVGPKGKGGLTLTGEEGFEIAWLPNESKSMIVGANGPQMIDLPPDAVVYTHEQSKKIIKQKSIPAGSHSTRSRNQTTSGGGGGGGSNSQGSDTTKKQEAKNADDAATILAKAGKVSVWWENMTRRIETTQRNIDKTQKKFDNLLKIFGGTAKDAQAVAQNYKTYLNKSIDLNKAEVKKANRELKKLDNKGKTSISYEVKKNGKKTTKPEKIKLGKYIKQLSDGTYIIDQKLITKEAKKNKSKAKAIKEAAEQKINDKVGKRNKAQDEITKAQEALDKLADDVYTTFYQWENSLNKIYFLSKRINDLSTQANIRSGQESLLSAKALAGFGGDRNELLKVLKQQGQIMLEQVSTNQQNLQATKQVYEDSLKLSTYEQRYKKAPDSKEAKADFEAAKWALGFLKAGGTFNEAQITKLEAQGYNSDTIERIKKVIEDIDKKRSDALSASADSFKTITEIYNKIAEYQEYISSFESELLSGLEEQTEKEINKLDKINANLSKAFKELLDEVKYQLDERRKKEDNIKTEKDLSQKQQRLTALQADTSGGHQVEIAQLQKEIAEAQQSHQRSLEDQLIEKLQHQGDKAEQQRQQQIDILNAQKELASELGTNLTEVKEWLKDPDKNKEQIKQAWLANKNYDELPQNEQEKLENEFEEAWMKYGAYSQEVDRLKELTSNNDYLNKNTLAIQQMTEAIIGNKTPDMTSTLGGNTSSSTSSSTSKSSNQNTTDKKSLDTYLNKYNEAVTAKRNGKKFGWIDDGSKASKYYTKLLEYSANGKLSDKELTNLISYGKAIGYSVKRVVSDLAKTDELTWVDIIKAAKKAKFSKNEVKTWGSSSAFTKAFNDWSKYKTGGLADYTGPAWLDGTPSKPELVLNAQDTKNFIALKDVLSKAIGSTSSVENTSNNATFEININVDHLNNDYDVDKVVERVKKKIVQDSSYRNVTQVRKFR